MISVKQRYQQSAKALMSQLSLGNSQALPRLQKVVVSASLGAARERPQLLEQFTKDFAALTGQKPVVTKARKAIAGFKLQQGQPVGLKVTLRGQRMYHLLERLINAVLPAIRDFKGIPTANIDRGGNLNLGLPEHTLFPEIGFERQGEPHGLQITIVPNIRNRDYAMALYRAIGLPLQNSSNLS